LDLDSLQSHHDFDLPAPTTDADLFVGRRTDLVDIEKGTTVIRISEADYAAAMSDHHRYIREAERLGPFMFELRMRRANKDSGAAGRTRSFAATQISAIGAFLSEASRIRKVSEQESAS
jgi:hypothetical protein